MCQHHWITEKAREFKKNIYFCFTDYAKAFDCVGHKIAIRPPYLPPEKSEAGQEETIRTEHGIMDCFQIGKGVHQGLYCHPSYLTFMQSTSCEIPGWMKHKLESRLQGEILITSDMQMT